MIGARIIGRRERIDCQLLGGRCEALTASEPPRCVLHKPSLSLSPAAACGPCGCPPSAQGERTCDGRDDDGDRHVDEGLSCGPVPIIAFLIGDAGGESSFSREEIEAEIAHANALLASQSGEPELTYDEFICEYRSSQSLWRCARARAKCVRDCQRGVREGTTDPSECVPPDFSGATQGCVNGSEGKAGGYFCKACNPDLPECYGAEIATTELRKTAEEAEIAFRHAERMARAFENELRATQSIGASVRSMYAGERGLGG